MKRKFKLFATVASLCLSVALMAFGVYAAAQVTYTVSGNVSYTMTDVLVKIKTTVAYAQEGDSGSYKDLHKGFGASATESTLTTGVTNWALYTNDDPEVTDGVITDYTSYDGNNLATSNSAPTGSVDVDLNTSSLWRITIEITTINPTGVTVAFTGTAEEGEDKYGITTTNPNYAIAEKASQQASNNLAEDTAKDGTVKLTLVYYVYLIDARVNIADGAQFSIPLKITQKAA